MEAIASVKNEADYSGPRVVRHADQQPLKRGEFSYELTQPAQLPERQESLRDCYQQAIYSFGVTLAADLWHGSNCSGLNEVNDREGREAQVEGEFFTHSARTRPQASDDSA